MKSDDSPTSVRAGTRARRAVFGLGSNLGSRESLVLAAAALLAARAGVTTTVLSRGYLTRALGPAQPDYVNAAVCFESSRLAGDLLAIARNVERDLSRERRERWGPRTIDVDLLWIDGETVVTPELEVPHPGLLERVFALGPLLDVAPDAIDPRDGRRLCVALERLDRGDLLDVWDLRTGRTPSLDAADQLSADARRTRETRTGQTMPDVVDARAHRVRRDASTTETSLVELRENWLRACEAVAVQARCRIAHAPVFAMNDRAIDGAVVLYRSTNA